MSADPNFISHGTKSLSHSASTQKQAPNLREGKDKPLYSLIHSLVVYWYMFLTSKWYKDEQPN